MKRTKMVLACLAVAGLAVLNFTQSEQNFTKNSLASSGSGSDMDMSSSGSLVFRYNNYHYYPPRLAPDSTLTRSDSCEGRCVISSAGRSYKCHSHGLTLCNEL